MKSKFLESYNTAEQELTERLAHLAPLSYPAKEDAVENLKNLLTYPPLLVFPRLTGQYRVKIDVCDS